MLKGISLDTGREIASRCPRNDGESQHLGSAVLWTLEDAPPAKGILLDWLLSASSLCLTRCWELSGVTMTMYVPGPVYSALNPRSSFVVRDV